MRWYDVFIKGIKEQIRDYWILIMVVVLAPLFIAIYYVLKQDTDILFWETFGGEGVSV